MILANCFLWQTHVDFQTFTEAIYFRTIYSRKDRNNIIKNGLFMLQIIALN